MSGSPQHSLLDVYRPDTGGCPDAGGTGPTEEPVNRVTKNVNYMGNVPIWTMRPWKLFVLARNIIASPAKTVVVNHSTSNLLEQYSTLKQKGLENIMIELQKGKRIIIYVKKSS
jgi:hypothetical protein